MVLTSSPFFSYLIREYNIEYIFSTHILNYVGLEYHMITIGSVINMQITYGLSNHTLFQFHNNKRIKIYFNLENVFRKSNRILPINVLQPNRKVQSCIEKQLLGSKVADRECDCLLAFRSIRHRQLQIELPSTPGWNGQLNPLGLKIRSEMKIFDKWFIFFRH